MEGGASFDSRMGQVEGAASFTSKMGRVEGGALFSLGMGEWRGVHHLDLNGMSGKGCIVWS